MQTKSLWLEACGEGTVKINAKKFPWGEPKKLLISEKCNAGKVKEYANKDTMVLIIFLFLSF